MMTDRYEIKTNISFMQRDWHAMYAELLSAYRAALARVAELEAQLDAQGWRAVTDYPANGQEVDLIVPATYYQAEYDPFTAEMMLAGYYLSDDGDMLRTLPTHWRPRPSPSIAAEATE